VTVAVRAEVVGSGTPERPIPPTRQEHQKLACWGGGTRHEAARAFRRECAQHGLHCMLGRASDSTPRQAATGCNWLHSECPQWQHRSSLLHGVLSTPRRPAALTRGSQRPECSALQPFHAQSIWTAHPIYVCMGWRGYHRCCM